MTISSATILIAAPIKKIFDGDLSSSDLQAADSVEKDIKKIIDDGILGNKKHMPKIYPFDFDSVFEIIFDPENRADLQTEAVISKYSKLFQKTGLEIVDLVEKIEEIKIFLEKIIPNYEYNDVLGNHKQKPSSRQIAQFKRIYQAVDMPLNIVAMIPHNSFTNEELEAVKNIYPEFYEYVIGSITDALVTAREQGKTEIGVVKTNGIKRFYGEVVAYDPLNVIQEEQQEQQAKGKSRGSRKVTTNAGSRAMPESERGTEL